jgi:CubicO group peptidase (beta-lactamase class C family)
MCGVHRGVLMRALILFSLFAAASVTRPVPDRAAQLDALLSRYEQYGYSGSVLIAKDGRIVLHKGYGFADRERGIRNEAETRYEIASLTKTFTAASILQLESKGKLRTSDPLSRFLGPFPPEKSTATIHHLATHTAGLVRAGAELVYGNDRARFVESVKAAPAESKPGARYRYSNAGYGMLAAVVEIVSGDAFEDYVRRHCIATAGLTHTGFRGDAPRDGEPPLARGYLGTTAAVKESVVGTYDLDARGAGGMLSTVGDLYRWHLALHEGRVLTDAARAKMFRGWGEEGYAWHVTRDAAGRRLIHKGGGMEEFASQILFYPDDRLVIIWTSNNLQQHWRSALNRSLAVIALGGSFPLLPPPLANASSAAYAGSYTTADGKAFTLAASEHHVYASANDAGVSPDLLLFPSAPRELTGFDPVHMRFTRITIRDGSKATVTTSDVQSPP